MILVNEPLIENEDIQALNQCVKDGWISSAGPYLNEFEQKWANYCTRSHGVAVSNGTAALQVALESLELEAGSEVIMPSFTIISCALSAIYAGLKPVFVDVHSDTWTMDETKIEAAITEKTRVIMPVHMYGHPCDMDPILAIAKKHQLLVVEDAAEAHGARYKGQVCGSFGDISCFSFYANKIITTGEGGMIVTSNPEYFRRAQEIRNLGFLPNRRFYHERLANNFRMTAMQAALGINQVARIEQLVEKKRHIAKRYYEGLKNISGIILPIEKEWAKNVYWMYGVLLDPKLGLTAAEVMAKLHALNIETRAFFYGLHQQPVLINKAYASRALSLPVTEYLGEYGFYLPSGLLLSDDQIDKVIHAMHQVFEMSMV